MFAKLRSHLILQEVSSIQRIEAIGPQNSQLTTPRKFTTQEDGGCPLGLRRHTGKLHVRWCSMSVYILIIIYHLPSIFHALSIDHDLSLLIHPSIHPSIRESSVSPMAQQNLRILLHVRNLPRNYVQKPLGEAFQKSTKILYSSSM